MARKTSSGQVLIEFLVLFLALVCLYSIISYRSVDLEKTKKYRWEVQQ